jgi:catechol 2,3-dioxygenase-like lactoylglutathione lyase family enzyme
MATISKATFVIAVPDLKVSAAFYRDILGFDIHPLGDPGWLVYVSGACTIMAGECRDAIPPAQLGDHSYFAYLQVESVESQYGSLVEAGAKICKTLRDEPWGMKEFGVVTADGHRIMFASALAGGEDNTTGN